ncbi:MAG: DUF1367 family protein [Alphaproteobacteria bacterium]|nr:DUF1367 family protein [Alphaproteobacteria bacterium]
MELYLSKAAGNFLVPADQQSAEAITKLKLGQGVKVVITRARNLKFHKKFMALMNYAFDIWEPAEREYKGEKVLKNFDTFRHHVCVLAGYGEASYDLNGNVKVRAKSISFANMSQEEFESLYQSCVQVVLSKILTNYTKDDLDEVIERVLNF